MKVITISEKELDKLTFELVQKVLGKDPAHFDYVVGIRRGGAFVAQSFLKNFPDNNFNKYFEVTIQRPTTKRKTGLVKSILKHLPYVILNGLRKLESAMLSFRKWVKIPDVPIVIDGQTFLVIDDAVDSGATLTGVVEGIRRCNPKAEIKTACITVTTSHPRTMPDYYIFNNKTLVRFPWATDYKG